MVEFARNIFWYLVLLLARSEQNMTASPSPGGSFGLARRGYMGSLVKMGWNKEARKFGNECQMRMAWTQGLKNETELNCMFSCLLQNIRNETTAFELFEGIRRHVSNKQIILP